MLAIAALCRRASRRGRGFISPRSAVYVADPRWLHEAFAFPIAFYHGFLLERRYGLSAEPPGAWLRDHVKATALGSCFSIGAAEVVYLRCASRRRGGG